MVFQVCVEGFLLWNLSCFVHRPEAVAQFSVLNAAAYSLVEDVLPMLRHFVAQPMAIASAEAAPSELMGSHNA